MAIGLSDPPSQQSAASRAHEDDPRGAWTVDRARFGGNVTAPNSPVAGRSHPPRAAVMRMIEALGVQANARVLVVGAGSGYVAASLAHVCAEVFAIERIPSLVDLAGQRLLAAGIHNVFLRVGDGREGWPEQAPFDGILVVAAVGDPSPALVKQLASGAALVFPAGNRASEQHLHRLSCTCNGELERQDLGAISFVESVGDMLLELGVTDQASIAVAQERSRVTGRPVVDELRELIRLDDHDLARALAQTHGLRFGTVDELSAQADPTLFERVPRAFCDHHQLLPIARHGDTIMVVGTRHDAPFDDLSHVFPGVKIERWLTTPTDFRRLWTSLELRLLGKEVVELAPTAPGPVRPGSANDLLEGTDLGSESHAVAVFEALLLDAIGERASDIHLERYGDSPRVRIRVDGELRDLPRYRLTPLELVAIVNVIKVRANLDISERRLPQGGRMRTRAGTSVFDLRIQTQPSLHGEHVVIRLLPQDQRLLTIEELGFPPDLAGHYRRLVDDPSSLVLVVGPTGSGKSTTLYAALQVLARDATRKVITIEDPIEYAIDGISQTQVKSEVGFGFADAMRSFVRQDPDVILIGEIRDSETALEAIRASQTGHLVFSTLHCNDATDAVQRLIDLGMHPNSIASELGAVIAQRLARRVCEGCRAPATPDPEVLAEVFPSGAPPDFRCFAGRGCARCGGHGTRGRIAVIEFMRATPAVRSAISRQVPVDELRLIAASNGLSTARRHALEHVKAGVIPFSELRNMLSRERLGIEDPTRVGSSSS